MNRSFLRRSSLLTLALLAPLAGGCVNQDQYDKLLESNRALTARNQELAEENNALRKSIADIQDRLKNENLTAEERARLIAKLEEEKARLAKQLGDFDERLRNMKIGPLDAGTDALLADLAAKYPDLLSYDQERGMLRFNSDVSFASGSYELTEGARAAIVQLSTILKGGEASTYDLYVIGHTDTQPVNSRAGRKFSSNDELSLFRGLSVRKALVGDGIEAYKVLAGGFGEDRPAVENTATGNTPQNRRVELYLTKSTFSGLKASAPTRRSSGGGARSTTPRSSSSAPAPAPSRPAGSDNEPMK